MSNPVYDLKGGGARVIEGFDADGTPVALWPIDARERMATIPPTFFLTNPKPGAAPAAAPVATPQDAAAAPVTPAPPAPDGKPEKKPIKLPDS